METLYVVEHRALRHLLRASILTCRRADPVIIGTALHPLHTYLAYQHVETSAAGLFLEQHAIFVTRWRHQSQLSQTSDTCRQIHGAHRNFQEPSPSIGAPTLETV